MITLTPSIAQPGTSVTVTGGYVPASHLPASHFASSGKLSAAHPYTVSSART